MARMRRKGDLPNKVCAACHRPFAWRKRWAKTWEEVRYCSDACRARRTAARQPGDRGCAEGETSRAVMVAPARRHP